MKITFVCSSALTTAGGIETTVLALAQTLARYPQHHVSLLAGNDLRERVDTDLPSVEITRVPFLHRKGASARVTSRVTSVISPYMLESGSFYAASSVIGAARDALVQSDVVSVHTKYDSLLFSRWALKHGIACVFHIQGSRFGPWFRKLDCSTRYVGVSENSAKEITARDGIPVSAVVPPGVPKSLLAENRREEDFLLFVARLQSSKGVDILLPVFDKVSSALPWIRLVIIGDGPARRSLSRRAQNMGLSNRIDFLGPIPHSKVLSYYSRALLLLFPSTTEVFPLVPLEAMAAGCPLLASDIGGILEATGGHAHLLPPGDVGAWAKRTIKLVSSREERYAFEKAGRAWASAFTWDSAAERYHRELALAVGDLRGP